MARPPTRTRATAPAGSSCQNSGGGARVSGHETRSAEDSLQQRQAIGCHHDSFGGFERVGLISQCTRSVGARSKVPSPAVSHLRDCILATTRDPRTFGSCGALRAAIPDPRGRSISAAPATFASLHPAHCFSLYASPRALLVKEFGSPNLAWFGSSLGLKLGRFTGLVLETSYFHSPELGVEHIELAAGFVF